MQQIRNRNHSGLLHQLKLRAGQMPKSDIEKLQRYIGSNKACYAIGAKAERQIVKTWVSTHPKLTSSDYLELLESLYRGESVNEISIAGGLLKALPDVRKIVEPERVDGWLDNLRGWGEVDSLCQSKFSANEVLTNWTAWKRLLDKLASDGNINKKRASLVLLTKPVRDSADKRLATQAFSNIEKLKYHREILVTKAVSWLLRDLTKHHKQKVQEYLNRNEESLPKIAIRETKTKILTGKKTGPRKKSEHST